MKPQKTKSSSLHPLEVCLRLLSTMGKAGGSIWRNGKRIENQSERIQYLTNAINWLRKKSLEKVWRTLPVDFRTFVEGEEFLNSAKGLWPEVRKCGEELNSGKYSECVLTGAIGVGKSHLGIYTQAYQVYLLSCMEDAHGVFELDKASAIVIIFQSKTYTLAYEVGYRAFRELVSAAPYFQNHFPFDPSKAKQMLFPNRIVVQAVSGSDTAALGQNVIGGVIDEANFMAIVEKSKQNHDGTSYDQALQIYNAIARRRETRFMRLGVLPGMLCLSSSRNQRGSFTDKKEAEARTNPTIYVYDKRLWEVRPDRFCGKRFLVFAGDETRKPRILKDGESAPSKDLHLYCAVPIEFRRQFENDILKALRDIGGLSTMAVNPFMLNTDAVAECFGSVTSVLSREDCDFLDSRVQFYPLRFINKLEPRFCHIDLALSRDSAGVSIGHVIGFKDVNRGDHIETLPIIHYDAILEVRPPRSGEIEFENIRKLLYTLRDTFKVPIKWVTFDQYQSKDSMQILSQHGFVVGYQSMDTTTEPYEVIKQAFYDGRIRAPEHEKALHEMVTLEVDTKHNKIDHPANSSKDVSDSMAGVAFGLTMRREVWVRHKVPIQRIPKSLTTPAEKSQQAPPPAPTNYIEVIRAQRREKERLDA